MTYSCFILSITRPSGHPIPHLISLPFNFGPLPHLLFGNRTQSSPQSLPLREFTPSHAPRCLLCHGVQVFDRLNHHLILGDSQHVIPLADIHHAPRSYLHRSQVTSLHRDIILPVQATSVFQYNVFWIYLYMLQNI